jgi:hypothetical protein
MAADSAIASPFTSNVLVGWEPVHPHIRYPVTLGLYREGDNYALFIAPVDLNLLRSILPITDSEQALVLAGAQVLGESVLQSPEPARRISWSQISTLGDEVDIIHLPEDSQLDPSKIEIPTPILAAPEQSVPLEWGSKLAISLNDGCHAAVISPDPAIIRSVLTGFMSAYAQSAMDRPISFPTIPMDMQNALVAPMNPGEWTELRFLPRKRYWMFEFAHQGDPSTATRWVAEAEHGRWRSGWSW